ncbi:uncharacterized protein LOC131956834 [Physella acuta]|uniref:uncharacterized protein LOC131956834 n=1 Tax=Physella acuta TaxID=109671 RepID=UPI0027DD9E6A|nr:uncharacterized protein LOC131956834 [Physella acuta]XP_059177424.1 uncharacterized protein LOC131956834 [Physella acuta]XP_059177425.1 uncharacterized protein LOC131956834 [Physella acuta]
MSKRNNKLKNSEEICLKEGEDWKTKQDQCEKKDKHHLFKNPKQIQIDEILTNGFTATPKIIKFVLLLTTLTGRINIGGIRFGTGFLEKIRRKTGVPCPCLKCKTRTAKTEWAVFRVTTVYHVVTSQLDVEITKFELFYDEDFFSEADFAKNVKVAYGDRLSETERDKETDWCFIECVTHKMKLVDMLEETISELAKLQESFYKEYKDKQVKPVIIVSHPHSGPKQVSFGQVTDVKPLKEVRENQSWCQYFYDTATCPGSSGAYVCILGQALCGTGYWFGHPHNHSGHSEEQFINCSSVGVESLVA